MKVLPFELIPFGSSTSKTKIEGVFSVDSQTLHLHYEVSQGLEDYLFDLDFKSYERKDGLWQRSCLEFFIRKWNSSEYIEVNLSPSGEWQAYIFKDYRKGREEFKGLAHSDFNLEVAADKITLDVKFKILPDNFWSHGKFNAGVTSVLEKRNKTYDYFALIHLSEEADFHHPDSFMLFY